MANSVNPNTGYYPDINENGDFLGSEERFSQIDSPDVSAIYQRTLSPMLLSQSGEIWDDPNAPTTPIRGEVEILPSSESLGIFPGSEQVAQNVGAFSLPPKGTWEYLQCQTHFKFPLPALSTIGRCNGVECIRRTAVSIDHGNGLHIPIHANHMGGPKFTKRAHLVASQYPQTKYWDAIYQEALRGGTYTLVDLTQEGEGEYENEPLFYPNEYACAKTDRLKIHLIAEDGWISTYVIEPIDCSKPIATVQRLHFDGWVDRGAISVDELHALVIEIERLAPDLQNDGLWIHCFAGVGRTGVMVLALLIKEQILSGAITKDNLNQKVIDLILELRDQRSKLFVANKEQFQLLIDFANSFFE